MLRRGDRWLRIRVVEEGESLVALLKAGEMRWILRERPLRKRLLVVVVVKLIELNGVFTIRPSRTRQRDLVGVVLSARQHVM